MIKKQNKILNFRVMSKESIKINEVKERCENLIIDFRGTLSPVASVKEISEVSKKVEMIKNFYFILFNEKLEI